MSYARFGWGGSDVYVFMHVDGYLTCCGCCLQDRVWVDDPEYPIFEGYLEETGEHVETTFHNTEEMVAHLQIHREAGHTVPDGIEDELRADDAENFKEGHER